MNYTADDWSLLKSIDGPTFVPLHIPFPSSFNLHHSAVTIDPATRFVVRQKGQK